MAHHQILVPGKMKISLNRNYLMKISSALINEYDYRIENTPKLLQHHGAPQNPSADKMQISLNRHYFMKILEPVKNKTNENS